jgi:hypothetical protein
VIQRQKSCKKRTSGKYAAAIVLFVAAVITAPQAAAKRNVDFNPELDFSKFKTFAYIGGVEQLERLQLNPDLIRNRIHQAVARELLKVGLKEVRPDQNPDLVVRYWATSQSEVNLAANTNWGVYGPYIGYYWGFTYNVMTATSSRTGTLMIDIIDAKGKDLAWRLYLEQNIGNVDKLWKKVDSEISKGFESFPPSDREKEEKRKERAEHPPKAE